MLVPRLFTCVSECNCSNSEHNDKQSSPVDLLKEEGEGRGERGEEGRRRGREEGRGGG